MNVKEVVKVFARTDSGREYLFIETTHWTDGFTMRTWYLPNGDVILTRGVK